MFGSSGPSFCDPSQQQEKPNNPDIIAEFKIVLVGDSGVGKSTFLGQFEGEKKHDTTNSADIRSVTFHTNVGQVKLNIWEPSGKVEPEELKEEFLLEADFGIIMFDVGSITSYENVPNWFQALRKIREDLPMVLLGNKVDITERQVKPKQIVFHRKMNLRYFDISSKESYNIEKSFVSIMRQLIGNQDLELIEAPQIPPPDVVITLEQMKNYEAELAEHEGPLPEDDDDL